MFRREREKFHAVAQGGAVPDDRFGLQRHAHLGQAELHSYGVSWTKIGCQDGGQPAFTHIDQAAWNGV